MTAGEHCPTCTYPNRSTAGLVCQTCGWDYANGEKPAPAKPFDIHDMWGTVQSHDPDVDLDAMLDGLRTLVLAEHRDALAQVDTRGIGDLIDAMKNADPTLCGACGETFKNGHACPAIQRGWEQGREVGLWEQAAALQRVRERVGAALAVSHDDVRNKGVSCGGYSVDDSGCFAADLAQRVRGALLADDDALTPDAADAHDRRVRAEALREAADEVYGDERARGPHGDPRSVATWLRHRADSEEAG